MGYPLTEDDLEFGRQFSAARRHDEELQDRRRHEEAERWNARLRADRRRAEALSAAKAPNTEASLPDSGRGWRVTPGPTSHEALELMFLRVHNLAWHSVPFRPRWRVRWGTVDGDARTLSIALACAAFTGRVIVVDRRH